MPDRDSIADAWLTFQRNWWAFAELNEQIRQDPSEAWLTILALLARTDDPKLIEDIGAGPLEDLVGDQGESVIDRVEEEALRNERLRKALTHVWLKPDENLVVNRLVALGCEIVKVN